MFTTPILLLIFNRPAETLKVFEEIRRQKPRQLFIAADGPRENYKNDAELCEATRQAVSNIDWQCEVKTLFQSKNLGCGRANANAIDWFFKHVDQGIILEDDCMPNTSFFLYCQTLLDKYRDKPEVMMICGTSYQPRPLNSESYYFSRYPHVWGWATWKRAWTKYNYKLDEEATETRLNVIKRIFTNKREQLFWANNLQQIINGLNTWDYQWMYWIWKNNGLCATPWQNLVSNIGFGPAATHTTDERSVQSQMAVHELGSLIHPSKIAIHNKADTYERFNILIEPPFKYYYNKLRRFAARHIKKMAHNG